jgi:hypothetical protein
METSLANNSAEFGALGQISVTSKSGTNQLHGDVFDRYTTSAFLSRNAFASQGPSEVEHALGGSLGGPVYIPKIYDGRDKTFFFVSYEEYTGSTTFNIFNDTVPTEPMQQGDFSSFLPAVKIYDPQTGQPFPGNVIPTNFINPVSQKIQAKFYPFPNFGNTSVFQAQNYREHLSYPRLTDDFTNSRIDQKISDKDSFFARVSWQHNPGYETQGIPTLGPWIETRRDEADTLSYTHIFAPQVLNEFRFGFVYNNEPIFTDINGAQYTSSLGLQGLAPGLPTNVSGLPEISLTGTGITPLTDSETYSNPGYLNRTYEFQDSVSWFHGKHDMKFGTEIGHIDWDNYSALANLFGSLTFAPTFTSGGITGQGNAYADFLLGIPTSVSESYPPIAQDAYRWFYNFFAQDDFKVTQRLTLNVGLRYQLSPYWSEQHDHIALFDPAIGKIVVPDGGLSSVSSLVPTSYVQVVDGSSAGLPQNLMYTDMHDFAPRIGLAYRPWGTRTVFRAGFGVFYDAVPFGYYSLGSTVPFVVEPPAYTNPVSNPPVILPRVFPATGSGGPSTITLPDAVNPHLPIPYTMQYNFTIEHQQWNTGFRISYVGTDLRQDTFSYNIDSPIPNTLPFVDKTANLPFPNYPGVDYYTNGSSFDYNGLTLEAQRAIKGGLYHQASYNWARDVGNYDWDGNLLAGPEDPFNFRRDWGPDQTYPTNRFTMNLMYQLPFGQGRHWLSGVSRALNEVVGGWQLSPIFTVQSGQFLTPEWSGSDPVGITYTTGSPAQVTLRPDVDGNPNSGSLHNSAQWFNTSVFSPPQLGQFGTAGVGTVKGPGLGVLDFAVMKELYFHGENGPRLQLQLQATNLLNRVNWSNPDTTLSDGPAFGTVSSEGGVNGTATGDVPGPKAFYAVFKVVW